MGDEPRFTIGDMITYKQIPPSIPSGKKLIVLTRLSGPGVPDPRYRIGYKTEEGIGSRRRVTTVPVINEIKSRNICSKDGEKKTEYAVDDEVKIDYGSHDGVIIRSRGRADGSMEWRIQLDDGGEKWANESELSEQEDSDSEMAGIKKRKSKKRKSKKRKSKKRKSKKRKSKKRKSKKRKSKVKQL